MKYEEEFLGWLIRNMTNPHEKDWVLSDHGSLWWLISFHLFKGFYYRY